MWFVNDTSVQGQFPDHAAFRSRMRDLVALRARLARLRDNLRVSHLLPSSPVDGDATVRDVIFAGGDRDLTRAVMFWLDRTGPFVDDDRAPEEDDYFEYAGVEVTDGGLGEAARRTKAGEGCATFSFEGWDIDFAIDPLVTDHGLEEERLGQYEVANRWDLEALEADILASDPPPTSWEQLVVTARDRFPHLEIADLHASPELFRQPFEASIARSALTLWGHLERYAADRAPDGSVGPIGREIVEQHFSGDRAAFSNESPNKIAEYRNELTFEAPDGSAIFAPWHGKISHRTFRMHFEWPLRAERDRIAVLYLGPKITKD